MYLAVVIFPLLSCVTLGLFGYRLGNKGSGLLSTLLLFLSFVASAVIFYEVFICGCIVSIELWDWFSVGLFRIKIAFLFDSITASMLLVVTGISFLVHLYSISYMEGDPHFIRFMSYLSLFTFFMIILVTCDNLVQMFLGWEGVGLSSYLLINFWFTRIEANKAALKAIIVNRFGDLAIIFALCGVFFLFRSFDYNVIFALVEDMSFEYINVYKWSFHGLSFISCFIFIGCVGKSAQLGLHTWLPDAMEGPTPVSALIHAATMVTAGVFLLIRMSPLLEFSPECLYYVTIFGGLTALFAGSIGVFQNDLKRVIAYSTCSQLGYMVFACGMSNYSVAIFHLTNHAFFKALLFLSAGSVIHALLDEQDMRRLGGLSKVLPLTYMGFVIGSLALTGFPYTTGYYSKDLILELSFSNILIGNELTYTFGVLGACFTSFYSIRLLYLTFLGESNFEKPKLKTVHEGDIRLTFPLMILCLFSTFFGYVFKDLYVGLGTDSWGNAVGHSMNGCDLLKAEYLPAYIKLLPVGLSIFFCCFTGLLYNNVAWLFYIVKKKERRFRIREFLIVYAYTFFNQKWFVDVIYNKVIIKNFLSYCYKTTFKLLDRGVIEFVGPTGLVRYFIHILKKIKKVQSGFIFNYIFIMVFTSMIFLLMLKNGVTRLSLKDIALFLFYLSWVPLSYKEKIREKEPYTVLFVNKLYPELARQIIYYGFLMRFLPSYYPIPPRELDRFGKMADKYLQQTILKDWGITVGETNISFSKEQMMKRSKEAWDKFWFRRLINWIAIKRYCRKKKEAAIRIWKETTPK